MPKMVIEVPDELVEVGKVMAEHLASLQRTMARLGTGKAVDYAAIEEAMQESAAGTELAGHRAILQRLDIDVPAVVIGGIRYTRGRTVRGGLPHHGRFGVRRTVVISTVGTAWGAARRQSGGRGEPAGRGSGRRVVAPYGTGDGARGAAGHFAGSASVGKGVWTAAVFARQFRAGGARGGSPCGCGPPGHRGRADRCGGSA